MTIFKNVVGVAESSHLKGLNRSLKEGLKWSITGFWLFFVNIKRSSSLIQKRILGRGLNINEKLLVKTTIRDAMKIVPFSFFIIVPFAEFALPFAIKLFPNMLPSTFSVNSMKEKDKNLLNKKKSELIKFHSHIMKIISNLKETENFKNSSGISSLERIQSQLLENKVLDQEELDKVISGPIKNEFELEKLNIETLQSISKIMGMPSIKNKFLLMLGINHKMLRIKNEDKDMFWDGIDQLNKQQLQKLLISRFVYHNKIECDIEKHKELLVSWIRLSSMNQLPISLILWVQAIKLIGDSITTYRSLDSNR